MIKQKRLPREARREQIIEAATRSFARNGFHGTTTRMLADEAAVSEALLFKHFPSKEAIYKAMLSACQNSDKASEFRRVLKLEPSTSALAIILHSLIRKVVSGNDDVVALNRLILRSLSEDGAFARVIFEHVAETWTRKIADCLHAARKSGDVCTEAVPLKSGPWLTQHIVSMIAFAHLSEPCLLDYKVSKERLTEEAVLFGLRGLGVTEEAIKAHYSPRALALLASSNGGQNGHK